VSIIYRLWAELSNPSPW